MVPWACGPSPVYRLSAPPVSTAGCQGRFTEKAVAWEVPDLGGQAAQEDSNSRSVPAQPLSDTCRTPRRAARRSLAHGLCPEDCTLARLVPTRLLFRGYSIRPAQGPRRWTDPVGGFTLRDCRDGSVLSLSRSSKSPIVAPAMVLKIWQPSAADLASKSPGVSRDSRA